MAVSLSLLAGAGWQFFDDNGNPLSGGLLYTYEAGTTTPQTTYTDSNGNVANANPIVLDAAGRVPYQVWLTSGATYKLILKTSLGITVWTEDDVPAEVDFAALAASSGSSLIGFLQSGTGAVTRTVQSKLQDVVSVLDFGAVGDGVADDTAAIQAALNYAAGLSNLSPVFVGFPGQSNQIYRITSQLTVSSNANVGICGMYGMPTIKYDGAIISTDGSAGAMVYFSGTDHSFGGAYDLFLDANSKAAFCIYAEGIVGNQFRLDHLHLKNASLDLICLRNSGTTGVLSTHIHHISAYALTTFSGKSAPSGRYGINLDQNVNSGVVKISDCNMDVSVSGCIAQQGQTYGGYDLVLDNVRFETNFATTDLVVQKFATAGQYGSLTLRGCKAINAGVGTINAVVHNISSVAAVGNVLFDPVMMGNSPTYLFQNDNDTTKNVAWDSGYNLIPLLLDGSQGLARFSRQSEARGPSSSPYSVVPMTDLDRIIHNNNIAGGALTINLPAISLVGQGFRLYVAANQAAVITVAPNGTDAIRAKAASATLASSGSQGDSLFIMSGPGSRWYVMGSNGTWT